MDRRHFVALATAAALAKSAPAHAHAETPTAPIPVEMPSTPGRLVPIDFTGLSYEAGQLYNADYFSPHNAALIAAFRGLSTHGVLRFGGHLSNITVWEGVGQDEPKQQRGVRHGIQDYWEWPLVDPSIQRDKHGMITRKAIRNLCGFLDAVNWRLIYGLNFASGNAERAADEASFVAETMGSRLLAFVVGNEADGFGDDPFFRAQGYNFERYFAEYERWVKTVRTKVPHAPFAGPDTSNTLWVEEFARRTRDKVVFLTSHFYAMGPASDPRMTAEHLLRKVSPDLQKEIDAAQAAIAASGTPYRMDEGNSCFGGGKDGVSNAYASALWVADYMLHVACAGFIGVNLHGGGTGLYTPIESSEKHAAAPRPMYYGMQFAQQFAEHAIAPCPLLTDANVSAYLGTKGNRHRLAILNKSSLPVRIQLPQPLTQGWVLEGPALDAKSNVRFRSEDSVAKTAVQTIPAYSAIIFED